jgi:hypothetical protein
MAYITLVIIFQTYPYHIIMMINSNISLNIYGSDVTSAIVSWERGHSWFLVLMVNLSTIHTMGYT